MSRTPAAELARLKVAFPGWPVRRVQPGRGAGFTAHWRLEGGLQQLYALTLADLEHQLWLAERTGASCG